MHTSAVSSLPVGSVSNLCLLGTGLSPSCSVSVACVRNRGDVEYMHQVHTLFANPAIQTVYIYTVLLFHYGRHFRSILAYALWPRRCSVRLPAKQYWRKLGTCQDLRPGAEAQTSSSATPCQVDGAERSGLLGLMSHACCLVFHKRKAVGRCCVEECSLQSQQQEAPAARLSL